MGGFLQALSALAPIAPAMSDAKDIRLARQQQQETFAQDQALKAAQLTVQNLAAQEGQQRLRAGTQPLFKPGSQPEFNPLKGTYTQPAWNSDKGIYEDIVVPGVSPEETEKYQLESVKRNRAAAAELMPDASPEDLDYLAYTLSGLKPPVAKFTPLPGAAGQPQPGPDGKFYVNGRDADGNIVTKPMGPDYKPPAPKPVSPGAQYANLLAKQILANKKQGPPLTNEEAAQLQADQNELTMPGILRAREYAISAAANNLVAITDSNPNSPTYGMDILVPRAQALAAANTGTPPLAGAVASPTGTDKKNQMLALSAIQQVHRMKAILRADPNLTGPGAGQLTRLQTFLGTQDPDAQQFLISGLLASEHGVAVFGGRNIHTMQDLNDALANMKTNPDALNAALDVIEETMSPWVTAGGRLPTPRTPGAAPANPSTPSAGTPKTAADYLNSIGVH